MSAPGATPLPVRPIPRALLDEAGTVTAALATLAARHGDLEYIRVIDRHGGERRLTPARLWQRAGALQQALAARGVQPGEIVLIALPTSAELLAAFVAALRGGAVPAIIATPANRFASDAVYVARLRAFVAHSRTRVVVADESVAELLRDQPLAGATLLAPAAVHDAADPPLPAAGPEGIATVQYSSGSTGAPKGVRLSHRALLNNIRATRDALGMSAADTAVNWLPLYHDLGLVDAFLMPLLVGAGCVLMPPMDFVRDPAAWLEAIGRYRGTAVIAPNFGYALCARRIADERLAGLDLSTLRLAFNGSEPVLRSTIDAFTARFAPRGFRAAAMTPGWGLAEGVCILSVHDLASPPRSEIIDRRRLAVDEVAEPAATGILSVSCGRGIPGTTLEIRDAARRPLADRRIGNIWVRTNSLFSGYASDPAATARIVVDGWLDTEDRGYLVDGELYFVAREKDLIVIGGEKYAPHDVEAAINTVAGVREGCVVAFGVLDETRGTEDLAAVVETRLADAGEQAALAQAIRAAVTDATGLGLRHLLLVPPGGIEKTTSGKLARRATRERYADRLRGDG